jgi:DNA-3-methyladenine glycosylase II
LPVGDLGLKKGIQRLYSLSELPEKEEMEKIAQKWRPYRSVATWYLWRSLNQFDIG